MSENMKIEDWNFFRVRPENHPTRRVVALGFLIDRYHSQNLVSGMLNIIRRLSDTIDFKNVENELIVIGDDYWSDHFDFGVSKSKKTNVIGKARARELAINVLLPFASAWGQLTGELTLRSTAAAIYNVYPKLWENQLTYHMKRQFPNLGSIALSACQQQGLIHIFKEYCRHRRCAECVVKV